MTRTVFDTAMVAHVWAQGCQEEGRNQRSTVFFEGPHLYSYGRHFLTGYLLPDGAAFLNSDRYSIVTSGHQSDARRAVRGQYYSMPGDVLESVAAFMESSVYNVTFWTWPDGFTADTPYGHNGRNRSEAQSGKKQAGRVELAKARPGLLSLFLKATETAPAESIVAAFRYAGAKPEEAAKAAAKVAAAHAKRAADRKAEDATRAKERAESWARAAVEMSLSAFDESVAEARAAVIKNNWRDAWKQEAEALKGQAKALSKARKAAKARGWTRIAADLKARESILRKGAAGLEAFSARSQDRMQWGFHRAAVQAGRKALQTGAANPPGRTSALGWIEARKGAEALGNACQKGIEGHSYMKARAALAGADLARMVAGLKELSAAFLKREEAAKAEERAAVLVKFATAVAAWRDGGNRPLPGSRITDSEGGALIRARNVERDESEAITGGLLETSWGASVPLAHALRAFRFLKLCRDTGQAWAANGKTLPVGHFRIEAVTAQGDFKAGCHTINWQEVAALAARLGVADLAPEDTTESRAHA